MTDRNRSTDILFSQLVRTRGFCQRCGGIGPFECAHIIRRSFLRTRWIPVNAWCLCKPCHYKVDTNAGEFAQLVESTISWAEYQRLHELAHALDTPKPDRVQIRKRLRRELNELEATS